MELEEILNIIFGTCGGIGGLSVVGIISCLIKKYYDKKKESPQESSAVIIKASWNEIVKTISDSLKKKDISETKNKKKRKKDNGN